MSEHLSAMIAKESFSIVLLLAGSAGVTVGKVILKSEARGEEHSGQKMQAIITQGGDP
jgi:predicted GNAT family N-acyltransferase